MKRAAPAMKELAIMDDKDLCALARKVPKVKPCSDIITHSKHGEQECAAVVHPPDGRDARARGRGAGLLGAARFWGKSRRGRKLVQFIQAGRPAAGVLDGKVDSVGVEQHD